MAKPKKQKTERPSKGKEGGETESWQDQVARKAQAEREKRFRVEFEDVGSGSGSVEEIYVTVPKAVFNAIVPAVPKVPKGGAAKKMRHGGRTRLIRR
jgi:hypothetical protein